METKIMDTKTKVFTAVIQAVLDIVLIGYFFSLYNGNENNVSFYRTFITILACFTSAYWGKQKLENKFLNTWVNLNGILFVIWTIILIVQLFI